MLNFIENIIKLLPYKRHIGVFFLNIYRRLFLCKLINNGYEYFYYISVEDLPYIEKLKYFFSSNNYMLFDEVEYKKQNTYILENWVFKKNIDYRYFIKFQKNITFEDDLLCKDYSEKILNILLKYYCIKKIYFGKYSPPYHLDKNMYRDVKKTMPLSNYRDTECYIKDMKKDIDVMYKSIYNIVYFKNTKRNSIDYDLMLSYAKLENQIKNHYKLISKYI